MMPQGLPGHVWKAVVELSDCGTSAEQVRKGLAAWAERRKNGAVALVELTKWDRRIGVWCACAVAESVLIHVPAGESRPRKAVETARKWVLGQATVEQVQRAGVDAFKAAAAYQGSRPNAPGAAAHVTRMVTCEHTSNSILAASDVAKLAAQALPTYKERRAGLKQLLTVIAQAIIDFPIIEMDP